MRICIKQCDFMLSFFANCMSNFNLSSSSQIFYDAALAIKASSVMLYQRCVCVSCDQRRWCAWRTKKGGSWTRST